MSGAQKKQPQKRGNAAEANGQQSATSPTENSVSNDNAQGNSAPTIEVSDGSQTVVRFGDVLLPFSIEGYEPLIRDEDYAKWLGFERPRVIRDLIKRMIDDGKLTNVSCRRAVRRQPVGPKGKGEREYEVDEFWLTKTQALLVATQSNTKRAWAMTETIVRVFEVVTRSESSVLSREIAEREFLTAESRARELSKLARLAAEALAPFSRSSIEQLTMIAIEGAKGVVCYGGTGRELAHASMEQFWSMRSALIGFMRFAATLPKPRKRKNKLPKGEQIVPPLLPLATTLDLPTMTVRLSLEPKSLPAPEGA